MSILAQSPDLTKIIKKAVDRIGENHSLSRDNKGVTMRATEIEKDRKEFRKTKVIEESLKAAADEMAEKLVLENTIDGMIKDVIQEQTQEYPKNKEEEIALSESTTNVIKKLVNKKLKNNLMKHRSHTQDMTHMKRLLKNLKLKTIKR